MGEINMSLEPGGMGDKLGNMYEDRYFAVLMLRLVRERIKAITVEKLGPVGDYSEYITEEQNGRERYFQCKASNGTKPQWSVSDLERYVMARYPICLLIFVQYFRRSDFY